MQKILVVEDEASILTLISFNLEKAGYQVITAMDGKEALSKVSEKLPDLVILDIMLPYLDGLEVVKQLRLTKNRIPVILLTARGDEIDKVLGLELGADDYVTKPFSPRELLARIKALLRRAQGNDQFEGSINKSLTAGVIRVDPESYQAYLHNQPIDLTTKEFELLLYFVRNKGRVVTREQLLDHVWNYDFVGDSRIVDVHISHLREKIEQDSKQPKYIKTIRGIGYKFEEPKL